MISTFSPFKKTSVWNFGCKNNKQTTLITHDWNETVVGLVVSETVGARVMGSTTRAATEPGKAPTS